MRVTFITYSNGYPYDECASNLVNQAKDQFDDVIHFRDSDIEEYKIQNSNIWNQYCEKTGDNKNGFWIWKPYIISLALQKSINNSEHIIVYCDSKYSLTGNIVDHIKKYFLEEERYIFALETHHFTNNKYLEVNYSKGDSFNLMGVDMVENEYHSWAGFLCLRNCKKSETFINDWVNYCKDERIVTDMPSIIKNHRSFIQNRYDQTVFSLLLKKYKIQLQECELSNLLSGNPSSKLVHRVL
jgi:hypothetical protein